jgi:hypothetical protein
MTVFVVEHMEDGIMHIDVEETEDLDTNQFGKINKIFLCENHEEADWVVSQLMDGVDDVSI